MKLKNISLVAITLFLGTGLVACGDDKDKTSGQAAMETPAMSSGPETMATTQTASETTSEPMADEGTTVEGIEDNGVIYQDEIYKNWPYQ